jgi:hypothetical protein
LTVIRIVRNRGAIVEGGGSGPGGNADLVAEGSGTEWVTFARTFELGEITGDPFLSPDAGGTVTHQAYVQAVHPDGSARHVTFSAQLTGGAEYTFSSGTAPGGTDRTVASLLSTIAGDIARVNLSNGITGSMTVRDLLESATNRAKLNNTSSYYVFEQGPQMLGVIVSQDFSTHLRVTMHLRWYGGTTLWCGYLFENGYCNLNSMGSKSFTAELILNGSSKGTYTLDGSSLPVHSNRTMFYRRFWSTGGTLYARLTGAQIVESRALPNYGMDDAPSDSYMNARAQTINPMDNGDHQDDLDDTGYQPGLGIVSQWDAACITSNLDERMFNNVLRNAEGGMSYNYSCAMDSVTGEMVSISDRTTFTDQGDIGLGTGWTSGLSPYDAGVTGQPAAHNPSVGYLAYLLTGEWGYLRALHGWASFLPLWVNSNRNHTYNVVTVRRFYWGSVRGVGWSYRTVGQAAYITPDSHYLKAYYNNTVNGNFLKDAEEFNATYSLIGLVESAEVAADGADQYRNFMKNFLGQSVFYLVCDLGFTTGLPFARHIAKFVAGLMGNTDEFKWNFSASYTKKIGTGSAQANWYTTFTQMNSDTENVPAYASGLTAGSQALATAMDSAGDIPNAIAGSITGRPDDATSYYANMQPAVSYLDALAVDKGSTCWSRYISGETPDYSDIPQFNVRKRSRVTALQVAAESLDPGECVKFGTIPANTIAPDGAGFPVIQYASSMVYDPYRKQVRYIGRRSSSPPNFSYRFLIYDERNDTWSIDTAVWPGGEAVPNGHGYDHNAINPVNGNHIFRPYNELTPWEWDGEDWSALPNLPSAEIAGSMCWHGRRGLTYSDQRRLHIYSNGSWSQLESFGSPASAYHTVAEYNPNSQIMILGAGNASLSMRKLTASGSTSSITSPPFNPGSSEFQGLLCADPAGRGFIIWEKQALNWSYYDPDLDSWATLTRSTGDGSVPQTGTPNLSSAAVGRHAASCCIEPYAITMWVQNNGGGVAADVWIHRHGRAWLT